MPQSYFRKVADSFNVAPALAEIHRLGAEASELDRTHGTGRDTVPVVHLYQSPKIAGIGAQNTRFVATHALLNEAVAALGGAELYMAAIRILLPGGTVAKHRDGFFRGGKKRYHLALQCDEGARFYIQDQSRCYKPGELWHVDLMNRQHFAVNNSPHPRVLLLVDAYDAGDFTAAEVERIQGQYAAVLGPDWQQQVQASAAK